MSLNIDAIRARADAATEGPWEHQPYGGQNENNDYFGGWILDAHGETVISDVADEDADFIAHARTDVPALLDENARLRAALDAVRDRLLWLDSTEEMDPSSLSHRNVSAKGVASVIRRDIAAALGPKSEAAK